MPFDPTKPNVTQTMGDVIRSTQENFNSFNGDLSSHKTSQADHGLPDILAKQADYLAHKTDPAAHGIDQVKTDLTAVTAEVNTARGTQPTLAQRLSVALDQAGAIRLGTLQSKWLDNGDVPTYLTATTFTVPADKTKVYIAGVHLKVTISGTPAYAPIASSNFAVGVTTVTLDPNYPVLTSGLSKVEIGLLSFDYAIQSGVTNAQSSITTLQGQLAALQAPNRPSYLINGACSVAQRAAATLSTAPQFGAVDRFAVWAAGTVGAGSITQDTSGVMSSSKNTALAVTGVTLTGSGAVLVRQRIESINARALRNQTVSISAEVRHDVGSNINYVITVRKATATDNFTGTALIAQSNNISVPSGADTIIALTNISMADCSAGVEVEISANCGAVTTRNFRMSDVKCEIGSTATAFVAQDYATELAQCRRYFRNLGGRDVAEVMGNGQCSGTTTALVELDYTPMRVPPTISVSAAADLAVTNSSGTTVAATAVATSAITTEGALLTVTVASGLTAGSATLLRANNTINTRINLTAEL